MSKTKVNLKKQKLTNHISDPMPMDLYSPKSPFKYSGNNSMISTDPVYKKKTR